MSTATPRWIEELYPGTSGQDHLGLASVSSDQILATLSPGINVLTVHPRYYSFYVFLLDEFIRADRPSTRSSWVSFYRPREFIFSVAAHLCDHPDHDDLSGGIIGSRGTSRFAAPEHTVFNATTDYIESDLGGYGLYYRNPMAVVGLIHPGGPGLPYPIDIPTEDLGRDTAEAFRSVVSDTRYYREYFQDDATEVPRDVALEYGRRACLCQLQSPEAADRPALLDVFLHGGGRAQSRAETLRMMLDIASQTKGYEISESSFRQLLFFGEDYYGATYQPRPEVEATARRWRMYQAREYYSFALNALWAHLCNWGLQRDGDVRPVPMRDIWRHIEAALDFSALSEALDAPPLDVTPDSTLEQLVDAIRSANGIAKNEEFDEACGLTAPIQEQQLYGLVHELGFTPSFTVPASLNMLALTYLRFSNRELHLRDEWSIAQMGGLDRRSLAVFIRSIRDQIEMSVTIKEFARRLLQDYVIVQHQLVAASKLPRNTYRFQREGNSLRFFDLPTWVDFGNSRFAALSGTINELGLSGPFSQEDHPLTEDGRTILETGDLQWND